MFKWIKRLFNRKPVEEWETRTVVFEGENFEYRADLYVYGTLYILASYARVKNVLIRKNEQTILVIADYRISD